MWADLQTNGLDLVVRPFDGPPPPLGDRPSPFSAPMGRTTRLLARELRALDAERAVLEVALRETQIRVDGLPRADARPEIPAVRLSFDSRWGPLRYETGEYRRWEDNVRALALSMEALRAVDRYGVSKRGEQYRGWRALPMSTSTTDPRDLVVTPEQARQVIEEALGGPISDGRLDDAIRRAILRTHPDRGGDPQRFILVQRAKEILTA
jgi:hypothetical protein